MRSNRNLLTSGLVFCKTFQTLLSPLPYVIANNSSSVKLKKEDFSVSFGTLEPSSDGEYLVFSDGTHGGLCYNTLGLKIYDLKNKKDVASVFLPKNAVGIIEFDHWISNTSFVYKEETYSSADECRRNYENPSVAQKIYTIVNR